MENWLLWSIPCCLFYGLAVGTDGFQIRPPPEPIVNVDTVNNLITKLLAGKGENLGDEFQQDAEGLETNSTTQVDRSPYWDLSNIQPEHSIRDEAMARAFLADYDNEGAKVFYESTLAGWQFVTNMTEKGRENLIKHEQDSVDFTRISAKRARQFVPDAISDLSVKKLLEKLSKEGIYGLSPQKLEELKNIQATIGQIFADGVVCEPSHPPPCTLHLEPDLASIMASSKDVNQLYYVWLAWRNAVGPPMKPYYVQLVNALNEVATVNGFKHAGEIWQSHYGTIDLIGTLDKIYDEIRPLYDQLHAYIRNQLRKEFPAFVHRDGPIPAHLLGDMSASNWINLLGRTVPYPDAKKPEINLQLNGRNITVNKMLEIAQNFYVSLGFDELPRSFWHDSIFVRPLDRDMVCWPSSFDFKNSKDFRLKACLTANFHDFALIHKVLGNTFYQISYKRQPIPFREPPNYAFAKALTDAIYLSVNSDEYLRSVGLQLSGNASDEWRVNVLYEMALREVAFIPFGVLADKWRWQVYAKEVNQDNFNQLWWSYRERYQGLHSPARRSESDFDPGSNFQIANDVAFNGDVLSIVMRFQILKSLCDTAGFQGPLYKCNLHNSKTVGDKLKKVMELGCSQSGDQMMKMITGNTELSAAPMMEYMEPLIKWLVKKNSDSGETIGWTDSFEDFKEPPFPHQPPPVGMQSDKGSEPDNTGIAFPGEDCSSGQLCISDSKCNGTTCVCPPNTIMWYQNCLPNDPTMVGFGPGGPAFHVNLIEGNETSDEMTEPKKGTESSNGQRNTASTLSFLILPVTLYLLFKN